MNEDAFIELRELRRGEARSISKAKAYVVFAGTTDIMPTKLAAPSAIALVAALAMTAASSPVSAAPRQNAGLKAKGAVARTVAVAPRGKIQRNATPSARHPRVARSADYRPLYTDGRGSSFGFYPGPEDDPDAVGIGPRPWRPYRGNALRETMAIDQLTRGSGYQYGFPFE